MEKVVQVGVNDNENAPLLRSRGSNLTTHEHINDFEYSSSCFRLSEFSIPIDNMADKSVSFFASNPGNDAVVGRDNYPCLSCNHDFRWEFINTSKRDSTCETQIGQYAAPDHSKHLKELQGLKYSLDLTSEHEYVSRAFSETSYDDKISSINLEVSQTSHSRSHDSLYKENAFNFGIDTFFHGTQLGFGPQTSFRKASPMRNSFFLSYSPIKSLCSAYSLNKNEIVLDCGTAPDTGILQNAEEETMPDLFRVDSLFQFPGKLVTTAIKDYANIREAEPLSQEFSSVSIPSESLIHARISAACGETTRSDSSPVPFGGCARAKSRSTDSAKVCKSNQPENSFSIDKPDIPTERLLAEIVSNSTNSFFPSTSEKSTSFGILRLRPSMSIERRSDCQPGRLFSIGRHVGQPIKKLSPVKIQPLSVPEAVIPHEKLSVHFNTSTLDTPPAKSNAPSKFSQSLQVLRNISTQSRKHKNTTYLLPSSHASEFSSCSQHKKAKAELYSLPEIKLARSPEDKHKVDLENKLPKTLRFLCVPKIETAEPKHTLKSVNYITKKMLPIKRNTAKMPVFVTKSDHSKEKIQRPCSKHLETCGKASSDKHAIIGSFSGRNRATQGRKSPFHVFELRRDAADLPKAAIQKRDVDTLSSAASTSTSSLRQIMEVTPSERTALSYQGQELTQLVPSSISCPGGSGANDSKKKGQHETVPQFSPVERDALNTDRQRLGALLVSNPSTTDMMPASYKKVGIQEAQLCHEAIPQRGQQVVGDLKITLSRASSISEGTARRMTSTEKVQQSKVYSSFSASRGDPPSYSSLVLVSHSGAFESMLQEPNHHRTLRLWMNQFKKGEYWWDSSLKSISTDSGNAIDFIQRTQLTTDPLPLRLPKTETQRIRERKERVAALLARRREKMQGKFPNLKFKAEEQSATPIEPFLASSQSLHRLQKDLPLPLEGRIEARAAASRRSTENTISITDHKCIDTASTPGQNGVYIASTVVLTKQHSSDTKTNAQQDSFSNIDQASRILEKRPNLESIVKITLKDSYTLKVCSPWEQPNFFRVDELVQETGKLEHLQCSTLSMTIGNLFKGFNNAILLSSTQKAKSSSLAFVQHLFKSVVQRLPPKAILLWSMCTINNGEINHLNLSKTEKSTHSCFKIIGKNDPLPGITSHAEKLNGMYFEGAMWARVKDISQVSEKLTSAYRQVDLHKMGDRSMLAISLVLRRVINDKVKPTFSSLLVADVGVNCEILVDAISSLDPGPYGPFRNILRRCSSTKAVFLLSNSESDYALRLLRTQRRLCNIKDFESRVESEKWDLKHPPEDLSALENQGTYRAVGIDTIKQLTHSKKFKRHHSLISNRDSSSRSCSISALENVKLRRGYNTQNAADNLRCSEDSMQRISLVQKPTGVAVQNEGHNIGESDALVSRPFYRRSNKSNVSLISDHDASASLASPGDDRRFLPGATSIGPNGGPEWSNLPSNITRKTRFLSNGSDLSAGHGGDAESVISKYDDRCSRQSGFKAVKFKHKPPLFPENNSAMRFVPGPTNVRTLIILDRHCGELSDITYDDNVVFVTAEDDFEDYEMDEVIEMSLEEDVGHIQSRILQQVCETVCRGCNAALLCGVSRAFRVSPLALISVVNSIFAKIKNEDKGGNSGSMRGGLTVSIVHIKGGMVVDLLRPNTEPQKLVVAVSPIFGSCVHGVHYQLVEDALDFKQILGNALSKPSFSTDGRDHSFVFCSLIFKFKHPNQSDVLVCSLVASLAGQNVGLYQSVLESSPLVPHALFHYALGGPCFTVALLGVGGNEKRVSKMLNIERILRGVQNRPTHPGSIHQFVSSIREGLVPTLTEKLKQAMSEEERIATSKVLRRVEEMISDAEILLKDFDHQQPKAYLHEDDNDHRTPTTANAATCKSAVKDHHDVDLLHRHFLYAEGCGTTSRHQQHIRFFERSCRQVIGLPIHGSRLMKEEREACKGNRIKSLVCFDKRLLGGGSAVVEGNSVLVSTKKGACRFDVDEIIVRDGSDQPIQNSELLSQMVKKFVGGCDTGLLAADSESCAFTLLVLHKIVSDVLDSIEEHENGGDSRSLPHFGSATSGNSPRTVKGELQVSMSLIKDGITIDLLCSKARAHPQKFKMEYSAIFGPLIKGITMHSVHTVEDFDQFFSVAIDNADPELQTEDPGIMVIYLILTMHVSEFDKDDVFVSTFTTTAVFDAVHHYVSALEGSAGELLELFRKPIGGVSNTFAVVGISDEDNDTQKFLIALDMLARIVNLSSEPNSMNKLIQEIQLNLSKLMEHFSASISLEEGDYITKWVQTLELALCDIKKFIRHRWPQARLPALPLPV